MTATAARRAAARDPRLNGDPRYGRRPAATASRADQGITVTARRSCTTNAKHCRGCGTTNREDLTTGDQGYSACCNEPIEMSSATCRGHR